VNKQFFKGLLAVAALAVHVSAAAEDIDLFVGTPPSAAEVPNVLIILDNTANWSTAFADEMAALAAVLNGLPADKFRVGLMMFSETGSGNSGNDGGYVRAAIRLMDSATKTKYAAMINSFVVNRDNSNSGKAGKTMQEAYLYFSGGVPYAGNNKNKTDYTGNVFNPSPADVGAALAPSRAVWALSGNALSSKSGSPYTNPILSGCAKNFIIYISNSAAQESSNDTDDTTAALSTAGGSASTIAIPISPVGSQDSMADEWARFMKKSSLGVTTYTVEVAKATGGQGPGWTALLKSMKDVSGGEYYDVSANPSAANIANALNETFSRIQSVNSVFASVSLPVSVNTQGTYLNQVYVGMFRPDENSSPRWAGNLKQYKLGFIDSTLKLLDARSPSEPAINSSTGFITECARSFWTPLAVDSYWNFKPQGACLTVAGADASNNPDGNIVEKGGQAYKLRDTSNVAGRTVKTCSLSSCAALSNFNNTTVLGADLNPPSPLSNTERDALINWARGQDVKDEHTTDGVTPTATSSTVMRPSVHGDVVHSRPVAINFGSDAAGSRQVVIFYGGNDGMLHAVNGNRPDLDGNIGSFAPGQELWSFVPPEFYSKFKRLYDNSPLVAYPDQPSVTPTPIAKDYGMDGPVVAYKDASNAWIYATMRRGGRHIYAFDVTTPTSPSMLWRKGCPNASNDTDCSSGFSGIGQTWSSPRVLNSSGYDSGATPMLIMGGGYDTCEDADPNTCDSSAKGNKIYLMNAQTGVLLQAFDTDRAVVADISLVRDSAGLIKYAYAADLGGNVYRISGATAGAAIGATAPGSWTITKIAALGGTGSNARKFMFAPSVVADAGTHYVLLGSGDREKPLTVYDSASDVTNYFFMLKDKPTVATWLSDENSTCSANVICNNSLLLIGSTTPTQAELSAKPKGWRLALTSTEQVVTSAVTVFDVVTFSTHQPAVEEPGLCSNLGNSRVYNINYKDASSENGTNLRYEDIVGDGLPPSPVAGMVTLDDGRTVPFLIGGDPDSPLEGGEPPLPATADQPKARVFWNIEQ